MMIMYNDKWKREKRNGGNEEAYTISNATRIFLGFWVNDRYLLFPKTQLPQSHSLKARDPISFPMQFRDSSYSQTQHPAFRVK